MGGAVLKQDALKAFARNGWRRCPAPRVATPGVGEERALWITCEPTLKALDSRGFDISNLCFAVQVLDPNMDLRTVKHFIWKSGGDLTLHYRQKST